MTITLHLTDAEAAELRACIESFTNDLGTVSLDDDEAASVVTLEGIAARLQAAAPIVWRTRRGGDHVASINGQDVANVYRNSQEQIEAYPWAAGLSGRGVVTSFNAGRIYVEQILAAQTLKA